MSGIIRDSHEWWSIKGMMRRNLPYRQEGAYELEDTALVAKREKELPLEVISSIGAETSNNYEKERYMA